MKKINILGTEDYKVFDQLKKLEQDKEQCHKKVNYDCPCWFEGYLMGQEEPKTEEPDGCHCHSPEKDRTMLCGHFLVSCKHCKPVNEPKDTCTFDFSKMSKGVQCQRCSVKPCGKDCPYASSPVQETNKSWEDWIDNLMGEKLYEGKQTDFTATHIKDFIRNLLQAERERVIEKIRKNIKIYDSYGEAGWLYLGQLLDELKEAGDE